MKVVQHETRRIVGAAAKTPFAGAGNGPGYLAWAASYLMPESVGLGFTGALETAGCYVQRTLFLILGIAGTVLLHHFLGGLGLGHLRPKMHVVLLLYSCRSAFAQLTWRSVLSMRYLLGFHMGLWSITAWRDKGHAFAYRHLLFHGLVPMLAVILALYDAALQVNAFSPWQGLMSIRDKALQALTTVNA